MTSRWDIPALAFWSFVVGVEIEAGDAGSLWCTVALLFVGFHGWALLCRAGEGR